MEEPFTSHDQVPVAGGRLTVARAGPEIREADHVVLALHGITASHMAWRAVARELTNDGATCVLAPDLRGRGASFGPCAEDGGPLPPADRVRQ